MNVLVLTAYPPVLHLHGGGVRMFHNIRILAEKHFVHVVSFVENEEERELLGSLDGICESVSSVDRVPDLRSRPWSLDPTMMQYFDVPEMHRKVAEVVDQHRIEVLQCEYLQMAQFRRADLFTIWTAHEAMSANAYKEFLAENHPLEKVRSYYQWMAMLRYEVRVARSFDRVITMTEADAQYLRSYAPSADVRPIPIGVDAQWYAPRAEHPDRRLDAVFLGNFRHTPNVEAVRFLIDYVVPYFPEINFQVAGSNVPDGLVDGAPVELMGYQADTRVLYNRPNTIVLAPLFSGTGQRVKLLEAFSMAMPVVTTSTGAAGFPVSNGKEAFVADSAEGYRGALRALCDSRGLRLKMGRAARQMILDNLDWSQLAGAFLEAVAPRSLRGRRTGIGRIEIEDRTCHEPTDHIFRNRTCCCRRR